MLPTSISDVYRYALPICVAGVGPPRLIQDRNRADAGRGSEVVTGAQSASMFRQDLAYTALPVGTRFTGMAPPLQFRHAANDQQRLSRMKGHEIPILLITDQSWPMLF